MDKRILDIVQDFSQWRGDVYKLAATVAQVQREICEAEQAVPDDNTEQ